MSQDDIGLLKSDSTVSKYGSRPSGRMFTRAHHATDTCRRFSAAECDVGYIGRRQIAVTADDPKGQRALARVFRVELTLIVPSNDWVVEPTCVLI